MTFFGSLLDLRDVHAATLENPAVPLTDTSLLEVFGDRPTYTGRSVNEMTALGSAAVWRAVQISCNVPASLPFHAFRQVGEQRVPVYGQTAKLVDDPHPDMTPFEFWQTVLFHRKLWGNAYVRKLRNQVGQVVELWPIHPYRVKVGRESEAGRKVYSIDGGKESLSDYEVLHIPGIGYDGICGVSPIRAAQQSIGLGLAAEEYGARLFGSGSLATGVLQTEQRLTQTQADALANRWKAKQQGLASAHGTVVLDKGARFHQLTIPPVDAQFLESRRFQVVEICRWMGIPPFLMFDTEKSTSWGTGLEQQALGWVKFDLYPDLVSIEQRFTKHVLRPTPVFGKFAIEGLLRGDSAARAAFYTALWNIGGINTNEIRAYEDMAPVEGGDQHFRPMNMETLIAAPVDPTLTPAPSQEATNAPA